MSMIRNSRGRAAAALALLMGAGACVQPAPPAPVPVATAEVVEEELEWRQIASGEDVQRLQRAGLAWDEALAEARDNGFSRAVEAEGPLLDPHAALLRPDPSPGSYRCRMIKLGSQKPTGLAFNAYKPFFCYVEVEGELINIVKQTGSQRPAGWLYPDEDRRRLIFLGTLALGTEEAPIPYGENRERDMIGFLERVAPFRYRLVIPWPRTESKLDVIELVPVID
jgi:hypothetical protein